MKIQERIPLFLSADNNYAPFVSTTIASVLLHTNSPVDFYVMHDGITQENQDKINKSKEFFPNKDFTIKFIFIDFDKVFNVKIVQQYSHITPMTYARLFIPDLPEAKTLKRIIYSDVDVIFVDDIQKMYDEDLEGKPLGAISYEDIVELLQYKICHNTCILCGARNGFRYFQGGNFIVDCDVWRKQNISEKIIDCVDKHLNDFTTCDQDAFNVVLGHNYKDIGIKYCLITQIKLCGYSKIKNRKELNKQIDERMIIHYSHPDLKPWKNKTFWFADEFWKVVPLTAFEKDINDIYDDFQKHPVYIEYTSFKLKHFILSWFISKIKHLPRKIKHLPRDIGRLVRKFVKKVYYKIKQI